MYQSILKYLFFSCILWALYSCNNNPSEPVDPEGGIFQQEQINAETVTLNSHDNLLLVGTTEGAFKKQLENNATWYQVGLEIDSSKVVDFLIKNSSYYIAAVDYDRQTNKRAVLFETQNGGNSWSEIAVSFDEELRIFKVLELEENPDGRIFADAGGITMKSSDSGRSWSNINDWGGMTFFLYASEYHPQQIWTGGETHIFSPLLAKSVDGGDTWTLLNKNIHAGDATCYDVVLHPNDSDQVLVGMGGAVSDVNRIRKSNDGGQNWQNVLQGYNIRTLTHSADNPETVYASGINPERRLFFAASTDFGESWETIEWDDSPAGVQVNDMVSVMEDGQEVLYFGTNRGVFSYTFSD